jgi:hypothetical protein
VTHWRPFFEQPQPRSEYDIIRANLTDTEAIAALDRTVAEERALKTHIVKFGRALRAFIGVSERHEAEKP